MHSERANLMNREMKLNNQDQLRRFVFSYLLYNLENAFVTSCACNVGYS